MNEQGRIRPFPRGALAGAAALVGLALILAAMARISGIGSMRVPTGTPIESRDLRFEDRADGAVVVYDVRKDRVVDVLAPGTNGFVRGVLRGLARERKREDIGTAPSFQLTRWADGRLSIDDPATHQHIELEAFGQTNVAAFAWLLTDRSASR